MQRSGGGAHGVLAHILQLMICGAQGGSVDGVDGLAAMAEAAAEDNSGQEF